MRAPEPAASRRAFLRLALSLAPAAALVSAGGCGARGQADALAPIHWGREQCTRCGMTIGDVRFAVRLAGGPRRQQWHFDDVGCAISWLERQGLVAEGLAAFEVAALASTGQAVQWLDARRARYLPGRLSPMGYNHGAVADAPPGSIDFAALRAAVLATGGSAS